LRHPGVVRVFPIGSRRRYVGRAVELDRRNPPYYFVMELLDNTRVDKLSTDNRYSNSWRIEMIYQIAIILDYLHMRTVGHRDLKPDNILFRTPPNPRQTPQPVLIDFGLAGKNDLRSAASSAMTLLYAAPERIGEKLTGNPTKIGIDRKAVDIWALGVIAYELLNRRHPFDANNEEELAHKIINEPPAPMNPDVPTGIQRTINKMLYKAPEHRIPIEAVIQELETDTELISPRI
jgi:eukaryotic-like serine/threonine-protein kinase